MALLVAVGACTPSVEIGFGIYAYPVSVEADHICSPGCDHFQHEGGWYEMSGHIHGLGCRHHFWGGRWHFVQQVRPTADHVHDADCGHYFCQGRWYYVPGHFHTEGCGHRWSDGRWTLADPLGAL